MQVSGTRSSSIRRPRRKEKNYARLNARIHWTGTGLVTSDPEEILKFGAFWIGNSDDANATVTLLPIRIGNTVGNSELSSSTDYAPTPVSDEYNGIPFSSDGTASEWKYLTVDLSVVNLGDYSDAQAGGRLVFYIRPTKNRDHMCDMALDIFNFTWGNGTTSTICDPDDVDGGTVHWQTGANRATTEPGPDFSTFVTNYHSDTSDGWADCSDGKLNTKWCHIKGGDSGTTSNTGADENPGGATDEDFIYYEGTGTADWSGTLLRTKSQWNLYDGTAH